MVDLTGGSVSRHHEGARLSQKRPTRWLASSRQRRRTLTRQGVSLCHCPATRQAMLFWVLRDRIWTRDIPESGYVTGDLATVAERHVVSVCQRKLPGRILTRHDGRHRSGGHAGGGCASCPTRADRLVARALTSVCCHPSGGPPQLLNLPQPLVQLVPTRENAVHQPSLTCGFAQA